MYYYWDECISLWCKAVPVLLHRFVPDKEFDGTDRSRRRDGPVQFTRDVEEDLFGLDKFFKAAKKGEKRSAEESSSRRDYDSGKSSSKKRREWSLGWLTHVLVELCLRSELLKVMMGL